MKLFGKRPAYVDWLDEVARKGTGQLLGLCLLLLWVYLLGIAVFGLFPAMLLSGLGETAGHVAWCVGAAFAAIGLPLGWVGVSFGQRTSSEAQARSPEAEGKPCGLLGSILAGAFVGFLAGIFFGLFHMVMWYSLTLSPLLPESWRSSGREVIIVGGHIAVCLVIGVLVGPFANVRTYPSGRWR